MQHANAYLVSCTNRQSQCRAIQSIRDLGLRFFRGYSHFL